jgi:CBS domain-containing protein
MMTVKQLLNTKGHNLWSATPNTSVYDALKLMAEKNVGALLVIDDNDHLIGIVSERDYARKVILPEKSPVNTPVSDIMTVDVYSIDHEDSLRSCMTLMTDRQVRHVPVFAGGRLVGIVSMRDIVKVIISQQEFMIEQLENYISRGG